MTFCVATAQAHTAPNRHTIRHVYHDHVVCTMRNQTCRLQLLWKPVSRTPFILTSLCHLTTAGTVEFIVDMDSRPGASDKDFYFMEMNTRLQVG